MSFHYTIASRLIASEACHRLASNERHKENRTGKEGRQVIENKKVVIYIFAPLLLLTLFMSMFAVESVSATQVAREWGHLIDSDPDRPTNEYLYEETICSQVDDKFSDGYWDRLSNYDESTTDENVAALLEWTSSPYYDVTWSTTWWVGDFLHPGSAIPPPYGHFLCDGHPDSTNDIWDSADVYQYATYFGTQASKQYFTFMWTCANGGLYWTNLNGGWQNISGVTWWATYPQGTPNNPNTVYGYYDYVYQTSAVGMPFAWTARNDMSLNGYTNPSGSYAYIGWENTSPYMANTPPGGYYQYIYFVYWFYNHLLGWDDNGEHQTISDSLDYAAGLVFGYGTTFPNSVLSTGQWVEKPADYWFWCKMRLLGNGNIVLPN
jgi:hypothetical protein